jgi:Protein of unknown function (DUF3592)
LILEIAGLALFLFVAVFLMAPMFRSGERQRRQKQWPHVQGVVTEHRVRVAGDTGFPEYRVRYRFRDEDREAFVGSPDRLGHSNYRDYDVRRAVEAKMAKKPIGSPIEIMINPANYGEIYHVEWELPARTIAFVVGAIFLVFLVIFVVIAFDLL